FGGLDEALHWGVPAGLLAAGTLAGIVRTWLRAPNRIDAALAVDERFGLRERVTTLLTLKAGQADSAPGLALLEDVHKRVSGLSVSERFPLTLPWRAALPPLGGLALAG